MNQQIKKLDPFRYLVPSDVFGAYPYTVDLLENKGLGMCSCKDWATRRKKMIDAGQTSRKTACKHIIKAKLFLADEVVKNVILRQPK